MKKLLWIVGGLFVAFVVALVSIPLFVDVDKYRPMIVAEANKHLNGELELGKLKLSLWGAVKVNAEGIRLKVNGFPEPMLDTQEFHLEIPYGSLIAGKPQVIAVLRKPKILVRKELDGRMNVLELMRKDATAQISPATSAGEVTDAISTTTGAPATKPVRPEAAPVAAAPEAAPAATTPPAAPPVPAAPAAPSEPAKVPAIIADASLGVTIHEGNLDYQDKMGKSTYSVNGLELTARNLGLGSAMDIALTAPVKGAMPNLTFAGPVSLSAQLRPVLVNRAVRSVKGQISVDASKLTVEAKNGAFRKTDQMALTLNAKIDGDERETVIPALEVRFHGFRLHGKGRAVTQPLTTQVEIISDPLKLDQVQEFVPIASAYQLKGLANVNVKADYTATNLRISGDAKVTDGSVFMAQYLKAPVQFQLQAGFSESSLTISRLSLAAPESDLQINGSVRNFLEPQFNFAITGKSFNVDKVLVLPEAGAKSAGFALVPNAWAAAPGQNPMLELAKNPMFLGTAGTLNGQIGRLVAYGAAFDQVNWRARLQKLVLYVQEAGLHTFGGSIKANGEADLKAPALPYKTAGSVAGVSAKQALAAYFPQYQNTLEGTVDAKWDVSGASFPESIRKRSLKGTAKVTAKDGALKSVDFQESINSAMQKIPFLKDKKPIQVDNGFRVLTADLRFADGVVQAEPIEIQPRGNGFPIKGKSRIDEALNQESFFDIFDPHGKLPKELHAAGKPALSLRIHGPLMSPKVDYEYTVKKLAGTAGKNIAKEEGKKLLEKVLGGSGEGDGKKDALKDAADKLKKKFKFF